MGGKEGGDGGMGGHLAVPAKPERSLPVPRTRFWLARRRARRGAARQAVPPQMEDRMQYRQQLMQQVPWPSACTFSPNRLRQAGWLRARGKKWRPVSWVQVRRGECHP